MATTPTVQALDQIMAELQPSVQGQVGVINQQKAASAGIYDAQRAGLDAQKVKGFNDINTQATGRGMAFSGIPLNEQAEYLSTKYLPGIQAANAQQNMDALSYDRQSADLNANIFNRAFDWRNQQVLTLNDWNKMLSGQEFSRGEREASQVWQAEAARLDRDFRASQAEKDRAAQAAQNAASRAATEAVPLYDQLAVRFEQMSNEYGDVTPNQWKVLRAQAKAGGMSDKDFADIFWNYADDKIYQQYLS